MFVAIAAIAILQGVVILAVLCFLTERLARNIVAKRSEARLRSYEPHILGLLIDPADIAHLIQATGGEGCHGQGEGVELGPIEFYFIFGQPLHFIQGDRHL